MISVEATHTGKPQLLKLDRRVGCQQGLDDLRFTTLKNSKIFHWGTLASQVALEGWPNAIAFERVQVRDSTIRGIIQISSAESHIITVLILKFAGPCVQRLELYKFSMMASRK